MSPEHVKTCPDCAEEVKAAAAKCRFCNYRFDETPLDADASTEPERISRRARWPWLAAASFLVLAVGVGAYLAATHSSAAAADETYANCKTQTAPVFTAIQGLNSHLEVGMNQDDYSNAVGDTKAVFDRLQADKIPSGCVKVVASLDRAMRWYSDAASEWDACIQSDYCTPDPQPSWDAADGHVAAARRLLESLRSNPSKLSSPSTSAEQDSEAKSTARNLVSQVESCATDYAGEYTNCGSRQLSNTGLSLGVGKGQVQTTTIGSSTYTIDALSRSGTHFTITKGADGTITRTCDRLDQGGCSLDGSW